MLKALLNKLSTAKNSQHFPDKKIVKLLRALLICSFLLAFGNQAFSQNYRPGNLAGRKAFTREIARLEILVDRKGEESLPMNLVPRVQAEDVIRIRMLDEPINGIRPSESHWDWTLTVAFVNPSRNEVEQESVSREIYFKRDGWYREHLVKVPYDSQPVFFLYPKPKYRKKIKKLISKNFNEIKEIGEKTLEIAGAYAQIGSFLNELQGVINQNPYGYGGYSSYNSRNIYGNRSLFRDGFVRDQLVERLAQSFNIALPNCWRGGNRSVNSNDFVGRAQCIAKNVRLEDFDLSVSRMLRQGGLLAATKLIEKYPQLAYWINVAAAAADLIIKILRKTPLKIVPTMASMRAGNQRINNPNARRSQTGIPVSQKISLFAEKPATDNDFVTAFPIVLHKWQADPDPEIIELPIPNLLEPCLHLGQNILKNTDLSYDWLRDPFTRDFRVIMSAENGFSKEFRLTKNLGMSGWMLNLNPQDIQAFPKVKMAVESKVVATRGFNQLESKKFSMPISGGGKWEISRESLSEFSVGGKRRIVIKNTMGSCRCLQTIKYKPSFGGEFLFTAGAKTNPLKFSEDGKEAEFEIDTANFQPGQGTIELMTYGSRQPQKLTVKLYPLAPEINKLIAHKGDNKIIIEGNRIEQIKTLNVGGKLATSRQTQPQPAGNKRTFTFSNPREVILSNSVTLKLNLEGNRVFEYPKSFQVLPARPAIAANDKREIDAIALASTKPKASKFDLSDYPLIPVDTEKLTAQVKTSLTDYSFKAENISIETRIENGQVGKNALPRASFDVLDSFNLRINFALNQKYQQFLAGRRLQFRIKDKVRGNSDWYTLRQTFVRIPEIESIVCREQECNLTGKGLDYIGQISTDGGKVWQPAPPAQPTPDGKSVMTIQGVRDKKLLKIKLRDFPKMKGLSIK